LVDAKDMNPVIVRLFTRGKLDTDSAPASITNAAVKSVAVPPPVAPPPRPSTGQVGRWKLGRLRSERDGVAVFDAWADEAHGSGSPYVVKLARRSAPQSARDALAREAAAAREVMNSHIVSIFEAQLRDTPQYVVMPRLRGRTLAETLADGRPLPVATALWFARQAAQGLAVLHEKGWLHGDVKPDNLLVSPQGHLTLVDLGCARRLDGRDEDATPYLAGTPAYLAPEAFCSRLRVDPRSDLFSLGVVLFQMLTGRLPFAGDTAAAAIESRMSAATPDARSLNERVPLEVSRLTAKLLAREPLRRPPSAPAVAEALTDLEIAFLADRS
jgi:serine/threonine-protein kinase